MADTDLVVRNDSGLLQVWGGMEIGAAGTYIVQEADRLRFLDDDRFRVELVPANAVVNNGIFDLSEIVAVAALRQDRTTEETTLKRFGVVTVGSYLTLEGAPPALRQFVVPFTGYFSRALVTALSTTSFTVGINVNDVQVDTIMFPSSGSPQGSLFEPLTIVVQQDDAVSITLVSGAVEEPSVQLTLQDF
ncbi:hypothetical protein LCGC14_0624730 [marine sediment metagenome]|uniref:Uncharacterized protein n=1 Tax=marine sediment metagenome TaxID=412755 RepID=A0A0F9UC76_9ZZZZ